MDRKHTVHHRCNGQPHSHEHSRNPHDQKSPTAFSSFLPVFLSLMFYRSTRVRNNILAPCTIATVILCFGVCKVTLKSSFQISFWQATDIIGTFRILGFPHIWWPRGFGRTTERSQRRPFLSHGHGSAFTGYHTATAFSTEHTKFK